MPSKPFTNPLLTALTQTFDLEELRTLCFDLNIDFDSLRGEGKEAKARELILYCQRRRMLDTLVAKIVAERPNVAPQIAQLPARALRLPDGLFWRAWPWYVQLGFVALIGVALVSLSFAVYRYWVNRPDVQPAQAGETLVLIAAFRGPTSGDLLPERRIDATLRELQAEITSFDLRVEPVEKRVIASKQEAKAWGERHGASLVIWGWYDAEYVEANLTLLNHVASPAISPTQAAQRDEENDSWQLNKLLHDQVGLASQIALGWLAFLQGNNTGALKIWDKAIATAKAEPLETQRALKLDELYYLHGVASRQLRNEQQAQADFAQAEQINPNHLLAVYQNGEAAYTAGRLDEALAKAQRVIDNTPAPQPLLLGPALRLAARVKRKQGKLDEAIQLAERSVVVAPDQPLLWTTLSDLYLMKQNWVKAAETATKATALPPNNPASYFNLGRAQLHLHNADATKSAYSAGLGLLKLPGDQNRIDSAANELKNDRKDFPELANGIDNILALLYAAK